MLKAMRDNSQSFIIYIMFGVLVLVFAFSFGPGSGSCGGLNQDFAARVNGEVIRRAEYETTFRSQLDYMRQTKAFGGGLNDDRLRDQLRKQVIDQLIDTKLISQHAAAMGMTVTDTELLGYLETRYAVKQVDFKDYESWVSRNFGTTVAKFEQRTRGDVVAARLERIIRDNVTVSDGELQADYRREHDRAKIDFIRLDPRKLDVADVTDADADALLAADLDKIKARYDTDVFKYRTQKEVKARQILKRLPADATEDQIAKVRNQLAAVITQLEGGADFVALAASESEDDATKATGGDLGFVKRGEMAPALVNQIFAMKADEVSPEPVRTPQGLHLLQVTEIKPPARQEFEEVKQDVARTILADEKRDAAAEKEAAKLLATLSAGKTLADISITREEERAAREEKREVSKPIRTENLWVLKGQEGIPGIGTDAELHAAIFAASIDAPLIAKPYKVGRFFHVVVLTERETPDMSKFDEEKETLRSSALYTKRSEVYRAWLKHLREKAKIDLSPQLFGDPEANEASS